VGQSPYIVQHRLKQTPRHPQWINFGAESSRGPAALEILILSLSSTIPTAATHNGVYEKNNPTSGSRYRQKHTGAILRSPEN